MLAKLSQMNQGATIGRFIGYTSSGKKLFEVNGKIVVAKSTGQIDVSEYHKVVIDEAGTAEYQKKKKKKPEKPKQKKRAAKRQAKPKPGRVHIFEDDQPGSYLVKYSVDPNSMFDFWGWRLNFNGLYTQNTSGSATQVIPKNDWDPFFDPSKLVIFCRTFTNTDTGGFPPDFAEANASIGTVTSSSSGDRVTSINGGIQYGYQNQSVNCSSGPLDFSYAVASSGSYAFDPDPSIFYSFEGGLLEFKPAAHTPSLDGTSVILNGVRSIKDWVGGNVLFATFIVSTADLSVIRDENGEAATLPVAEYSSLKTRYVGKIRSYFMHMRLDMSDGTYEVRTTLASDMAPDRFRDDYLFYVDLSFTDVNDEEYPVANFSYDLFDLRDWSTIADDAFEDDWIYGFRDFFKAHASDLNFIQRGYYLDFLKSNPAVNSPNDFNNLASIEFMFSSQTLSPYLVDLGYENLESVLADSRQKTSAILQSTDEAIPVKNFFGGTEDIISFILAALYKYPTGVYPGGAIKSGFKLSWKDQDASDILEENGIEFQGDPIACLFPANIGFNPRPQVPGRGSPSYIAARAWFPPFTQEIESPPLSSDGVPEGLDRDTPGVLTYLWQPTIILF